MEWRRCFWRQGEERSWGRGGNRGFTPSKEGKKAALLLKRKVRVDTSGKAWKGGEEITIGKGREGA